MTLVIFVAIVAAVGALALRVIGRPGIGILIAYLLMPGILASAGRLDRYAPLPAPALVLILALTVVTAILAFSRLGHRVATSVSVAGLVGFQVFRVPVEWVLHRLYLQGTVPVQMTYSGRNLDILSGVTAGLLGLWLARRGQAPKGLVLGWNLLGLGLLANIVVIAVLSTPVPFRSFTEGPANLLPSTFPYVWLPSFLVQAALFGHLVLFRRLARQPTSA